MILVTGAAGLLGSALLRRLMARSLPLRATDLPGTALGQEQSNIEICHGDLLDLGFCRDLLSGVSTVIHAAARQHHSRPPRFGRRRFFQANVEMTRNLVRAMAECVAQRLVLVSSDMVYGLPNGRSLEETDAPSPIGPYGRSKLDSERVALAAAASGRLSLAILRPRLIIGPGRLGVLQSLFERIRAGRPVPTFGSGANRYQMVAVDDVASACELAALQDATGVFNLGSIDPPAVRDLLTTLIRRAGSTSRLLALPDGLLQAALWALHSIRAAPLVPEQFRIAGVDYVLNTDRARRELGWQPRHSDADMLWAAYESWRDRRRQSPAERQQSAA